MKGQDKPGAGQHVPQCRLIEIGAGYMQRLLIAFTEKAGEFIPCPAAGLDHSPQNLGGAGLDASAVWSDQQALLDFRIAECNTKVPSQDVPTF
jgi:hypothetical protein